MPASGTITMAQVATELGVAASNISLNDANVRAMASIPSGTISMSNMYGKSTGPMITIATISQSVMYGYSFSRTSVVGAVTTRTFYPPNTLTLNSLVWSNLNRVYTIKATFGTGSTTQLKIGGTQKISINGVQYTGNVTNVGGEASWQWQFVITVTLTSAQFDALPKSGTVPFTL